jgi:hypothetical protein
VLLCGVRAIGGVGSHDDVVVVGEEPDGDPLALALWPE